MKRIVYKILLVAYLIALSIDIYAQYPANYPTSSTVSYVRSF